MADAQPLAPCPFCGAPAHGYAIEPHSHSPSVIRLAPELPDHPGSYVIEGQCACGSGLIGADETEVVARWNRRTPKAVQRKPLTRQQLREAFHKETGCTLGGDIDMAERVCGVVERAHGITTNGRKDAP